MRSRPTYFVNVDLELESDVDLRPLVDELGERVFILHAGPYDGAWAAFLELNRANDPEVDDTLRGWLDLVDTVSESAREAWFAAKRRDFDVGICAGMEPHMRAFTVQGETLRRIAAFGARLTFTVYAPPKPERPVPTP
ncbi:MAG: hypothetical protein IV100_21030 [Myxococcales bacterium]|nr:hypothetical protein [Myxococcales bacterium]